MYVIKVIPPPLSLEARVVVDTKFFIQFSIDGTRQELFYVLSKVDERMSLFIVRKDTNVRYLL